MDRNDSASCAHRCDVCGVRKTFEWGSFRLFGKVPKPDIFVGLLVAVITVFADLAIAVIVGLFSQHSPLHGSMPRRFVSLQLLMRLALKLMF